MVVWGRIMQTLPLAPLDLPEPEGIEWARADLSGFDHTGGFSRDSTWLPFVAGSAPRQAGGDASPPAALAKSMEQSGRGIWKTIRGWFH